MGVGAPHGRRPAVQIPGHGPLLAGGLGVEVHHRQVVAAPVQKPVGGFEGTVQVGVEVQPAHQVQYRNAQSLAGVDPHPPAGHPSGVVGRAENAGFLVQIVSDLDSIPGMIPQCNHICPGLQHTPGLSGGDAHPGGIFSVDHGEVGSGLVPQVPQAAGQDILSSLPYHVSHGQ